MEILGEIKRILGDVLQLGERVNRFDQNTKLLGSIPEFDSMAVVSVITAIEEQFGITVDDDEIQAETFETLGSLVAFVKEKLST